jgi:FlaA1/EpsC-like NDP-sugar epimerase
MLIEELSARVIGTSTDRFAGNIAACDGAIRERITGRRVLVVGGAGSIGSASIQVLLPFQPKVLHVVDQNENNLAELVRDLRSRGDTGTPKDFRALPLDFGSSVMQRFLAQVGPYDLVMNFAAVKHVRSEKDVYSLLHMLDTNVLKQARLLCWLSEMQSDAGYFSVSTDKAANPVNMMGASKRAMEHVLFSGEVITGTRFRITSARFANVAFSDGSLLHSFLKRLEKFQPLAVPRDTKRYFISAREAGQICVLAATCGRHGEILVPDLDPAADQQELEVVAREVLRYHGYDPRSYEDEFSARAHLAEDVKEGRYPLLLTPLDTSGEKPFEEFAGEGEEILDVGLLRLKAVAYLPSAPGSCRALLRRIEAAVQRPEIKVSKEQLVEWLAELVPQFHHRETGRGLDERM